MKEAEVRQMPNEVGTTGLNHQGLYVYEEFLPKLRWPQAAKIYQEMADNDPTVGAILYLSTQLVRRSKWSVSPASDSEADKAAAAFLEECINDMATTWGDFIGEALSMFVYGWSFHEIVYKRRQGKNKKPKLTSKYNDGRIGWGDIPIRSQSTLYGWEIDDDGTTSAMIQQAPPLWKITTIPMEKGLLFRTKSERNNPEGRSLLRNAYRPWYFKKRIEEIEGIGIERDLAGLPVLTPPAEVDIWGDDEYSKILYRKSMEMIRNVRRDQSDGVVLPNGWDFKLLSTGGARQFDTNGIINRYDQRIAVTMLSDLVLIGSNSAGSYALTEVKQSLLAASLEAQLKGMAELINNKAVVDLIDLNYFGEITGYPTLVPGEVETPSLKDLGDFFQKTGMKLDDDLALCNAIRDYADLPEMSEEDFEGMQERRNVARQGTAGATEGHIAAMGQSSQSEDGQYHINRPRAGEEDGESNV